MIEQDYSVNINDFEVKEQINHGAYGVFYRVEHKREEFSQPK